MKTVNGMFLKNFIILYSTHINIFNAHVSNQNENNYYNNYLNMEM